MLFVLTSCENIVEVQLAKDSFDCTDIGINTIEAIATDDQGDEIRCQVNVTITANDTGLPTITDCPNDMDVDVDSNGNYTIPDFTGVINATDAFCPNSVTITQTPAIGSILSGNTTQEILLTATDSSGNEDTCSFNLIVSTLSVEDFQLDQIEMYPNPATERIFINHPQSIEITEVIIYDILGKQISNKRFSSLSANKEMSLNGLSSGLYITQIRTNIGVINNKLVVE